MAIIRKLTLFDILKLQKLVNYVNLDVSSNIFAEKNFTPFPLDVLHDLLPVEYRFLQESYVAVEGSNILGLIGLIPDGSQKHRWKINRLVLNANGYDTGKQLIDYVVNKYGGAGVETFITYINSDYVEALSLFKTACLFRSCSQVQIWQLEDLRAITGCEEKKYDFNSFRRIKPSDSAQTYEFYQQSLYPQFRHSLAKNKKDFNVSAVSSLKQSLTGNRVDKFILENKPKNMIEGYFNLYTSDKSLYWLDINLSLPYCEYARDIVCYSINQIKETNPHATLKVYVRKYTQGSVKVAEILEQMSFKCISSKEVLVKDYWKVAKVEESEQRRPIVIFPDMSSPASFR